MVLKIENLNQRIGIFNPGKDLLSIEFTCKKWDTDGTDNLSSYLLKKYKILCLRAIFFKNMIIKIYLQSRSNSAPGI
jgi:hypothetical protein